MEQAIIITALTVFGVVVFLVGHTITGKKTKKATFNLPPDVLAELDKAMAEGVAPSKNALVERALVKELKELRRRARKARWEEGARDPALLKDISEVEVAFQTADAETAGRMD